MHLFGLTGGIASGKSTVGRLLSGRGVPVIDADALAREIVAPGMDALREIVQTFGAEFVGAGGALDREALARRVFTDPLARQRLNAITHPRIAARAHVRAAELAAAGAALACYEASLIVENGLADAFRPLVVSACPEELQMKRLLGRDGYSRSDALARIRAQKPLADKLAVADYVIDTSGTIADSARQTDEVLRSICIGIDLDAASYGLPSPLSGAED